MKSEVLLWLDAAHWFVISDVGGYSSAYRRWRKMKIKFIIKPHTDAHNAIGNVRWRYFFMYMVVRPSSTSCYIISWQSLVILYCFWCQQCEKHWFDSIPHLRHTRYIYIERENYWRAMDRTAPRRLHISERQRWADVCLAGWDGVEKSVGALHCFSQSIFFLVILHLSHHFLPWHNSIYGRYVHGIVNNIEALDSRYSIHIYLNNAAFPSRNSRHTKAVQII